MEKYRHHPQMPFISFIDIINVFLFVPRILMTEIIWLGQWVYAGLKHCFRKIKSLLPCLRRIAPNFIKVIPKKHESIKSPESVLIDECLKTKNGSGWGYRKSEAAIIALAEVMCPHGEFGCGKHDCNITPEQRKQSFKKTKERLEKEYIMNAFHRNHRWRLEFGNKEDDAILLLAQSARIIRKASFFKKGLIKVTFYSKPIVIDYLAKNPRAKVARVSLTEGDGSLMSYIEFKKFKLKEVDLSSIGLDFTSSDISTINVVFSFSKSKFYGTIASNGPVEKAII